MPLEMAQNRIGTGGFNYFAHYLHGKSPALFNLFMPNRAGQYSAWLASGINSIVTSTILVGLASQMWLRRRRPKWYRDYNYILGGALDGGAQVMIFVLSFAVFGASGIPRPFPAVSTRRMSLVPSPTFFCSAVGG